MAGWGLLGNKTHTGTDKMGWYLIFYWKTKNALLYQTRKEGRSILSVTAYKIRQRKGGISENFPHRDINANDSS